ncbi:metallophosphoesterase [Rhodovibrio sodomensis]|nr:metallophosphoesterase [Rhodovibrio sodomensis]
MKLAILSDLHLEQVPDALLAEREIDVGVADVLVLAGDVDLGTRGLEWAAEKHPGIPIVYVGGNHEPYKRDRIETIEALRAAAAETDNVRFLENEECRIEGADGRVVRFLGCTLWTDFMLHGPRFEPEAKIIARMRINDFRLISERGRSFTPYHAIDAHKESLAWLRARADESGPWDATAVVTHHGVSNLCQPEKYRCGENAPAFVSALEGEVEVLAPDLWVTGHTHYDHDFRLGGTRVVSKQEKYLHENPNWGRLSPMVVEV